MSAGTEMRSMCKRDTDSEDIYHNTCKDLQDVFRPIKENPKSNSSPFPPKPPSPYVTAGLNEPHEDKLTVARPCQRATGEDLSMGTRGIGNARAGATGTGLSMSSRAASTTAAVRPSLRRFRSVRRSGSSLPVV